MNATKNNNVIIHDADNEQWLLLEDPVDILVANDHVSLQSVLKEVENQARNQRHYVAGFVAYEAASAMNSALKTKPSANFPLAWFGVYGQAKTIDFPLSANETTHEITWRRTIDEKGYKTAIKRVRDYIREGDTYQVNYSFRLRTPLKQDPWLLFIQMIHAQGYGYGAFINTTDWCICSASHELFFSLKDNTLTSKPMKGTVARGHVSEDDKRQAEWLQNSDKNRAENLMIVDMVRNDMGQVVEVGSVETTSLFDLEKFPTLWQMTSTVKGKTDKGIKDIFTALFPAASITGAPKARTMEIISDLETDPRKIYTGSIGLVRPDNSAQFNVAIRTVLVDKKTKEAEYGVGGGIVWDSEATSEFDECQTKARILTHIQPKFSLFETLLWTPEDRIFLLQYHLDRLMDSANYFSWDIDIEKVKEKLDETTMAFSTGQHRLRLLVSLSGKITIETQTHKAITGDYRLHLANDPVHAGIDPFLYHKTTERQVYDDSLKAFPDFDDVLLFNQHGEVTESCIANIVVECNGELLTPPISCGLLAGTYRRYLLEKARIKQQIITIDDLKTCSRFYLINSVRGMWQVALSINR